MRTKTFATSMGITLAAGIIVWTPPAVADPKPNNDSQQTSVCDNGETYTFPVVHHAADPSSAVDHVPALVPGSNVVLHPLSFSGTVSFEVDGSLVDSFPVELTNQRTANPAKTIACHSTYTVTAQDGTLVHVDGTDTFAIAGH
jgi:hypothetical protein